MNFTTLSFEEVQKSYGNLTDSSKQEEFFGLSEHKWEKCRTLLHFRALKEGFRDDLTRIHTIYTVEDTKAPEIDLNAKHISPMLLFNIRPNGKLSQLFIGEVLDSKEDKKIYGSNVTLIIKKHHNIVRNEIISDSTEEVSNHIHHLFHKNRSDFGLWDMFKNIEGFNKTVFANSKYIK